MATPGPRTTPRYTHEFKATAVRLSLLPGVAVESPRLFRRLFHLRGSAWITRAHRGRGFDASRCIAAPRLVA